MSKSNNHSLGCSQLCETDLGDSTGVISATLVSIHSSLDHRPLTTLDKSLITSITSCTALLASPLSGPLADTYGRRPIIFASDLLFVLGALLQAFASTVVTMAIGRAVVGLAIGAASALTPLYIAEAAPAKWRGRLVTISALFITGGQVVAYAVGWAFAMTEGGWRWMVGLGVLPALLQAVGMLKMPESPRWLVREGQKDVAEQVLGQIHGGDERVVRNLVKQMEQELKEEQDINGWESSDGASSIVKAKRTATLLWNQPSNRKALTIACILQGGQQLCGFVSVLIPRIRVNFEMSNATVELTDVLFRNHIRTRQLQESNGNCSSYCFDQFHLYTHCLWRH